MYRNKEAYTFHNTTVLFLNFCLYNSFKILLLKHIEGTFGSDDGAFHKILLAYMHSHASQIEAKFLHIFY